MEERRIIGLDLGIASEHTVRVLTGDGKVVAKRKAVPTTESLRALEAGRLGRSAAGDGARGGDGTDRAGLAAHRRVLHPPGPQGLPGPLGQRARHAAVLLAPRQVQQHRRRGVGQAGHHRPRGSAASSSSTAPMRPRWTAGCGPVTGSPKRRALHKVRIKDLVRQLLPMTPLTGDIGAADLAVLER